MPAFARLLRAQDGDFAAFYRTVKKLAKLPRAERDAVLRAMMPEPAGGTSPTPPPVRRCLPTPLRLHRVLSAAPRFQPQTT